MNIKKEQSEPTWFYGLRLIMMISLLGYLLTEFYTWYFEHIR